MASRKGRVIVVCACLVISALLGTAMPWVLETLENLWDSLQVLWELSSW